MKSSTSGSRIAENDISGPKDALSDPKKKHTDSRNQY